MCGPVWKVLSQASVLVECHWHVACAKSFPVAVQADMELGIGYSQVLHCSPDYTTSSGFSVACTCLCVFAAQVNGDSGNDIELFEVPGVRGCVVSNAHPELRQFAEAAVTAGSTHIAIAMQPCAGGIVETLLRFGSVPNPAPTAALLRGMVSQMGLLQSNAMAGNLSLLAEPGATWVTPAGRVLEVAKCTSEPVDAAAAGLTWVDAISARPLLPGASLADAPAGEAAAAGHSNGSSGSSSDLLVVTYQLWSFKGQGRDSSRVRQCSAILHVKDPAAADGYKLLHLHEGVMDEAATATAAFQALAAAKSS